MAGITKCGSYYKVRPNSSCKDKEFKGTKNCG